MRKVLIVLSLIMLMGCAPKTVQIPVDYDQYILEFRAHESAPFNECYITSAEVYVDDEYGWLTYHFYNNIECTDVEYDADDRDQYGRFLFSLHSWYGPKYELDGWRNYDPNTGLSPNVKYAMYKFESDTCITKIESDNSVVLNERFGDEYNTSIYYYDKVEGDD